MADGNSEDAQEFGNIKDEAVKVELLRSKWKGRRRMAWFALFNILAIVYCVMFAVPPETIKAAQEVLTWAFIILGAVIIGYMGSSAAADVLSKRGK